MGQMQASVTRPICQLGQHRQGGPEVYEGTADAYLGWAKRPESMLYSSMALLVIWTLLGFPLGKMVVNS